jgi:hypothetical protein
MAGMTRLRKFLIEISGAVVLMLSVASPGRAQEAGADARLPIDARGIEEVLGGDTRALLSHSLPIDPDPGLEFPGLQVTVLGRWDSRPPVLDRKFAVVSAGLLGAMTFDLYSTFKSESWCPGCREANPYAAPFVDRGPGPAFAAGALFDAGVLGLAAAMRRSSNPAIRRIWWVPSVALMAGHGLAARHNFGLREQCRQNPRCAAVR